MPLKKFKKFILEASDDSTSLGTKRLMDGFYSIVSKKEYEDADLKTYLNELEYEVTPEELDKIRNLHVATDLFFKVHNRDY